MTRDELVAVLKARKVSEESVKADLYSPLCNECEGADIYDRSPEACVACARLRLAAAQAADAERLAEALEAALDEMVNEHVGPAVKSRRARAAFLQSLTGPTTRETERP